MSNNPVRFSDPSGHMLESEDDGGIPCYPVELKCQLKKSSGDVGNWKLPKPSGNNLEINILAGISIPATGIDGGPTTIGLYYFSFGVVTDHLGNIQLYSTTKDQTYTPGSSGQMGGYTSGIAEVKDGTDAIGIGITVSRGVIYGDSFTTKDFLGKGYSHFLSAGPAAVGKFEPYDKRLNYEGYSAGYGFVGGPFSIGDVATDTAASKITVPPLDPKYLPVCHMLGQCGTFLFNPFRP